MIRSLDVRTRRYHVPQNLSHLKVTTVKWGLLGELKLGTPGPNIRFIGVRMPSDSAWQITE